ncbi:MAG: hypothetical protein KKG76_09585 [Euryarchaeota archaeon]|nr:hypothetical protein [Euryarchaeota archaeon]MBU4138616.1 hypothetical protein [Euryarchaeota archaeon]
MLKKFMLLSMLIIASVFLSGCVFEDTSKANQTIGPDFIPKTNLPTGFTFMGTHDYTMEIANTTVSGFEGVYRYGGEDIYIQAFKHDNPETLLSQYKADQRKRFREDLDPFEDISINGHAATKFADVGILNGKEQKKYSIIWAKGDYLVMVGSSADPMTVFSLASTTGY